MNENLNKKSPMDAVKRFLFDNKVILMFVVLSIACILISGANISYIAGEVFSRFGRFEQGQQYGGHQCDELKVRNHVQQADE